MKQKLPLVLACSFTAATFASTNALAQTPWCFHGPGAVLPPSLPNVTDANVIAGDDGWLGALTYTAGDTGEVTMYSLLTSDILFLGFDVRGDVGGVNPNADGLAIGLELEDPTAPNKYVQLTVQTFPSAIADCSATAVTFGTTAGVQPVNVTSVMGTLSGGSLSFSGPVTTPAPGVTGSRICVPGTPIQWRIELRIDLTAAGWPLGTTGLRDFFVSVFRGRNADRSDTFSYPADAAVGEFLPLAPDASILANGEWGQAKLSAADCPAVRIVNNGAGEPHIRTSHVGANAGAVVAGETLRFLVDVENTGSTPANVTATFRNAQFGLAGSPGGPLGVASGTVGGGGPVTLQTPLPGVAIPATATYNTFKPCIFADLTTTTPDTFIVNHAQRRNVGFVSNPTATKQILLTGKTYPARKNNAAQELTLHTSPASTSLTMTTGLTDELAIGYLAARNHVIVQGFRTTDRYVKIGSSPVRVERPAGQFMLDIRHALLEKTELAPYLEPSRSIIEQFLPNYTTESKLDPVYRVAPKERDERFLAAVKTLAGKLESPDDIRGMHPAYFHALPSELQERLIAPYVAAAEALERSKLRPPEDAFKTTLKLPDGTDLLAKRGWQEKPIRIEGDADVVLALESSYEGGGKPPCDCCCRKSTGASPVSGSGAAIVGLLLAGRFVRRRRR